MRPKQLLAFFALFICINLLGQPANSVPVKTGNANTTQVTLAQQQETIARLQRENQRMEEQLQKMEKEIDIYRDDVRAERSTMQNNMSNWLTVIGIILAIFGVIFGVVSPIYFSKWSEKNLEKMLEDVKKQASDATTQATEAANQAQQARNALADIEVLKEHVSTIENNINKDAEAAAESAKKSKISELHAQAYAEKDTSKAIELYSQIIELEPRDVLAYYNRGVAKKKVGDLQGAIQDYDKVIEINPNYPDAYFLLVL